MLVLLLALSASAGSLRAVRAQDAAPRIGVPYGLAIDGAITVTPGPTPLTKYIVLGDVSVINPSHDVAQSFELADWALVDGDHVYHRAARKGLGAIDLSAPGVVFPLERFHHAITFLVPRTVVRASLQFTPQWYDQGGGVGATFAIAGQVLLMPSAVTFQSRYTHFGLCFILEGTGGCRVNAGGYSIGLYHPNN